MRDDVTEISYVDMDPALRAMIAYEQNDTFNVERPQPILLNLLQKTPVVKWEFGVAFFSTQDIVVAGRHPGVISTNPATGTSMGMGSREPLIPLHTDGDRHKQYRKLLDPLLTARRMEPWAAAVRELADELIDGFISDGTVDFHRQFAAPLPGSIFLRVFGLPSEDLDFLVEMKDRILKATGDTLDDREASGIEAGDRLRDHLRKRLAERKIQPAQDDLIGQFMTFEVDGEKLSDEEIVNIMHMFTVAGLDTVTASLSLIMAWLATHPDERRMIVADPSALPAAIEELMRVQTPVPQGGLRWAAEDIVINDVSVEKGKMIFLGWGTANVDPHTFDQPLDIDLTRRPNRHLAFAAGVHRCLGSHLARLELREALARFNERIPEYWIAPQDEIRYQLAGVRQAVSLPLTFSGE